MLHCCTPCDGYKYSNITSEKNGDSTHINGKYNSYEYHMQVDMQIMLRHFYQPATGMSAAMLVIFGMRPLLAKL